MKHPRDNNGSSGFVPPEFHGAIPVAFTMNDGLQSAYANQMNANAEHMREETRVLRYKNWWERGKIMLVGFGVFGLVFGCGVTVGVLVAN